MNAASVSIDELLPGDWPAVRTIYEDGIASGQATFQTQSPSWEEWDAGHLRECRLILRRGDTLAGWAALSPVSRREVYRGVAEVSVYVAGSARGQGLGKLLLGELVTASEAAGIWTLQASIFPQNRPSVSLHQACGFRVVGTRERIGCQYGEWRDVLLLERRSLSVGI
jgi:L-amino acid N-acyltransferase YncA